MITSKKVYRWGTIEITLKFTGTIPTLALMTARGAVLAAFANIDRMCCTEADMFERSFQRPRNFYKLPPDEQWQIDKELGILDWVSGKRTPTEKKRFAEHYEK